METAARRVAVSCAYELRANTDFPLERILEHSEENRQPQQDGRRRRKELALVDQLHNCILAWRAKRVFLEGAMTAESQPVHWKELTRAAKSEDDPARLLQLLQKLNQSLQSKARELAEDLLKSAA